MKILAYMPVLDAKLRDGGEKKMAMEIGEEYTW
jgi:hypothetical protein